MISSSFDTKEFVAAVKDRGYWEVLSLAEREALDAWRVSYKKRKKAREKTEGISHYERLLKDFISYAKSGIRLPMDKHGFPEHLRSLHEVILVAKPTE